MSRTYQQSMKNRWLHAIEPWLAGEVGPDGEQLPLPGMQEPPPQQLARALPFQLAFYADADGRGIRPTYARLARVNNVSLITVKRAMWQLERLGLIVRQGSAHRGKAQLWCLVLTDWLTPKRGAPMNPFHRERGSPEARKGFTGEPPPVMTSRRTPERGASDPPPAHLAPTNGQAPDHVHAPTPATLTSGRTTRT